MARREVPVAALLALCASALFQLACTIRNGAFHPTAVMMIVAAGLLVGFALRVRGTVDVRWLLVPVLFVVGDAAFAAVRPPVLEHAAPALRAVPLVAFAIGLSYFVPVRPVLAHVRFALLCALVVVLAAGIFSASPHPHIDVFDMQTQGADELMAGRDPYATVRVTDTNDDELAVPYTYPPVQLLATTLSRAATGDVRFAMLLALVLAVLGARQALRRAAPAAPELLQDAPLLIVAMGPLTAFVLDQAWADVVPLGLVGAAVWAAAAERRILAAVVFGLALSAKQPLVVGFPLLQLVPGFGRRQLAIALAVAAAVAVPFIAWNPAAFWHGTVQYFIDLAPRSDALTVSNLIRLRVGRAPGELLGASAALLVCAALWKRVERSLATFLLLLGLVLLLFFATGKIAFVNYYFLLAGLAALATGQLSGPAREASSDAGSGLQPPGR